jgi:hypothetical protein
MTNTTSSSRSDDTVSSIRKKIGDSVRMEEVFSKERIQECQVIIDNAHVNFFKDVLDLWQVMINDFASMREDPAQAYVITQKIASEAFEIKGKLDEVGYSLGMNIAKSLYDFAINDSTPEKHMVIYSKHIDAMNTVIKSNLSGNGGEIGDNMLEALEALIKKIAPQKSA